MLIITNFLQHIIAHTSSLHTSPLVELSEQGVQRKIVCGCEGNTFQRSLAAVNEQSPIFRFILWHSKLVQKLSNICTAHQVFLFKEKTEELLMSVVVKDDVSTVREEALLLQSGCQ